MAEPVWFHVDMDAFYASVEQLDNPKLRDRPVIVGGRPGGRGVVSACSYEARAYGVHSAQPVARAYELCPQGVFLPVRMQRYRELSHTIMQILGEYSPVVRQVSIDEAFLEMTGTERLLGPPLQAAEALKQQVRRDSGLTISIGIAPSRYLAKLASGYDKPDGLFRIHPGEELEFTANLPLSKLWGVGKQTRRRLERFGIATVLDLRAQSIEELTRLFGEAGAAYLYRSSRGIDPGVYHEHVKTHSVSSETTFEHDIRSREILECVLLELADGILFRLRREGGTSRVVTLKLRFQDFTTKTARVTRTRPLRSLEELYDAARELLDRLHPHPRPVRLLGVGLDNVTFEHGPEQGELFEDRGERQRRVEETVFALRQRYRDLPIRKARNIEDHNH